jgi:membrane protein implicated in regulation of membrane protease activity
MDADLIWLVLGVALLVTELITLTIFLGMLGVGALVASLVAFAGAPVPLQLGAFVLSSAGMLLFVRPPVKNALDRGGSTERTDARMLTGSTAVVVARVSDDSGQVRLNGELWRARPYSGVAPLEIGQTVSVAAVEGATLLVYSSDLS